MADDKFRKSALDAHNKWRKKHGVPAMKLNKDISKIAQKWADHIAKGDLFQHSKPDQRMHKANQMGENIAMKWTSNNLDFSGEEATDQWYAEIERYNFSSHSGSQTGHFTQVVWKDSVELGVGKAQTKGGKWLVVANYHPAGNFIGRYPQNVMAPVDGKIEVPKSGGAGGAGGACGSHGGAAGGGGQTKISTSTKTETRVVNGKKTTKTIVTKTTTHPDGKQEVETTETVKEG